MPKYLVIDNSDINSMVEVYESQQIMLDYIQNLNINSIEVYEIAKKVELKAQPPIIISE